MTAADLVAEALARARVGHLFVVSEGGGGVAVRDAAARYGLRAVATGSKRAACVMAATRGSLLAVPGCALVEDGKDLRHALGQAMRDRSPVVLVSGRALAGDVQDAVKASVVVEAASASHWAAHAARLAMAEPRGPVQLVVTPAVAAQPAVPVATSIRPDMPDVPATPALDMAAHILGGAIRPVLVVGRGCHSVEEATWIRALAESLPAPVLVTRKGKGALPDPHPLHLGLVERTGPDHPVLGRADLAVTIGVDPTEVPRDLWPSSLPVLHLGGVSWASPQDKTRRHVGGDVALVVAELAPRLRGRPRADWDVAEIDRFKRALAASPACGAGGHRLPSHEVLSVVREAMPSGTVAVIAVDDDDLALISAWQTVAPGELVTPTPPAVRGFALAAALGAGLARPDSRVVCFASPRQILDSRRELTTAVRLAPPLLVLVVGGVDEGGPASEALVGDAVAAGWSATGVASANDLRRAIDEGLATAGPVLIDARATPA
jgi:acetolactate synthase-1/2/3 large subunit